MKTILFDFENLSAKDKAIRDTTKIFSQAGANVVSSLVAKTLSRRAGVSFRNVDFTFADGQKVTLAVKSTGDVFEVKVNGKVTPIKNQDDFTKAVMEIAKRMDMGRSKFQAALTKIRIPLPPSIKVSRVTMLAAKVEKRDALKEAIVMARETLASITGGMTAGPAVIPAA